jgi:hypothetical protein
MIIRRHDMEIRLFDIETPPELDADLVLCDAVGVLYDATMASEEALNGFMDVLDELSSFENITKGLETISSKDSKEIVTIGVESIIVKYDVVDPGLEGIASAVVKKVLAFLKKVWDTIKRVTYALFNSSKKLLLKCESLRKKYNQLPGTYNKGKLPIITNKHMLDMFGASKTPETAITNATTSITRSTTALNKILDAPIGLIKSGGIKHTPLPGVMEIVRIYRKNFLFFMKPIYPGNFRVNTNKYMMPETKDVKYFTKELKGLTRNQGLSLLSSIEDLTKSLLEIEKTEKRLSRWFKTVKPIMKATGQDSSIKNTIKHVVYILQFHTVVFPAKMLKGGYTGVRLAELNLNELLRREL